MSRHPIEPALHLDRSASPPLTVQLSDALRGAMSDGTLRSGERLPSSRALAAQLGVSRTVVTEAYQQLYAEGWLEGRHGSGTFVAEHDAPPVSAENVFSDPARCPAPPEPTRAKTVTPRWSRERVRRHGLIDLRPGAPWVRDHDRAAWRRAWRHAAEWFPDDDPDPRGLYRLRELLAAHLRRTRDPRGRGGARIPEGAHHPGRTRSRGPVLPGGPRRHPHRGTSP